MGKVEYDSEKVQEVVSSLTGNGGNIKKTAKEVQIPAASVRQIMLSTGIEVKQGNQKIGTGIKKNNIVEAEIISDDYGDLEAAQKRFLRKVYKMREVYVDRMIEIVDFDIDPRAGKEIIDVANKIIEESMEHGQMTKSSSFLQEIAERMTNKKQLKG